MKRLALFLMLCASMVTPAFSQFTNAKSIQGVPVSPTRPADGQGLCYQASTKQWLAAACLNAGPTGATGAAGAGYLGTSSTNFTTALGSQTITTQSGLAYQIGTRVRVAWTVTPGNYVEGITTAYSGTSLTFLVDTIGGVPGTWNSWTVSVAGQPGQPGAAGTPGAPGPTGPVGSGYVTANLVGPDSSGTITGATHGVVSTGCPLLVGFRDNSTPQNSISGNWTVSIPSCDVSYSFASPQANYHVIISNGGSGGGAGGGVTNVSSANADIAVANGGTTPVLTLNSGTSGNNIVKLNNNAQFPASDGSLITKVKIPRGLASDLAASGNTDQLTLITNCASATNCTSTGTSRSLQVWDGSAWQNPVSSGAGGVTTTGSPANQNLTKFSGSGTITNGDLIGDVSTSGTMGTTLATVNSGPGTCGDGTHVCQVTTNGKGLVTSQTAVVITGGGGGIGFQGTPTATAILTNYDATHIQTPSATATMDTSGNISTPGNLTTGAGGSVAGYLQLGQGTTPSTGTSAVTIYGGSAITSYTMRVPSAAASGFYFGTNTSGDVVMSQTALTTMNSQSSTYTVLASDFSSYKTITVPSGTFTITLVASGSQPPAGQYIRIINYGSGVVTVARSGQNINGGTTSLTLPAANATAPTGTVIFSNGTDYFASMNGTGGGGSSSVGANTHVQTSNGLGGFSDGGCTMTGSVLTCGSNLVIAGAETALGSVSADTIRVDSTTHNIELTLNGNSTADATGIIPKASRTANQFVTNIPASGVQATALIAAADLPAAATTVTTGTTATLSGNAGYYFNQEATAATAVTYTLPTAAQGIQYCVGNSYNGSAANTGVLTVATSASGQFIIFTDGTLSATGGNVTSPGAGGDFACFIGVDSTHWYFRPAQTGWVKH